MRTLRTPESACPHCGKKLDAATSPDLASPDPGDITICLGCTAILKFDEKLMIVAIEQPELEQIQREDPEGYAQILYAQSIARKCQKPPLQIEADMTLHELRQLREPQQ